MSLPGSASCFYLRFNHGARLLALCRAYLSLFGRILHYNVDKGLPVAGRTQPRLGGGRVLEPMRAGSRIDCCS